MVRLFNAVAKAQKQQQEAQEGGAQAKGATQLSKAAFLAELQGKLKQPQVALRLWPLRHRILPGTCLKPSHPCQALLSVLTIALLAGLSQ